MLIFIYFSLEASNIDISLFKEASSKYNIEKNLLLAIVINESNCNKNAIGAMPTTKKQKKQLHKYLKIIECQYSTSKNENLFSIHPKTLAKAQKVLLVLSYFKIGYDVGLTQINIWNIKKRNLNQDKLLYSEQYAINIGAKILSECIKYNNGDTHDSIECYNKGTNKKRYNRSYSKKILATYYALVKKDGN